MDREIIKRRVGAIRRVLREKGVDCLIVTRPENVTYISGFMGDDSWVIVAAKGVYLLTDNRYTEQASSECVNCKIIARKGVMGEAVVKLIKKLKSVQNAAVEKTLSVGEFRDLRKRLKGLKAVENVVESARCIKDESEIGALRAAGRIAGKAFELGVKKIKVGMTENELAGILDFEVRKLGGRSSFGTIVAFGANASRPHHESGSRKLKKNDTVLIDFGVKYKGYCSDITRCFAVGKANAFYRKVYEAVKEAQAAAIEKIKAGVKAVEVDAAARDVIHKYGLPVYGHGTGHGLGLEVHEEPVVSAKSKGKLEAGMVVTIEPGVYMPGKLGVRIEDDVLVTEKGCKVLTRSCPVCRV